MLTCIHKFNNYTSYACMGLGDTESYGELFITKQTEEGNAS